MHNLKVSGAVWLQVSEPRLETSAVCWAGAKIGGYSGVAAGLGASIRGRNGVDAGGGCKRATMRMTAEEAERRGLRSEPSRRHRRSRLWAGGEPKDADGLSLRRH